MTRFQELTGGSDHWCTPAWLLDVMQAAFGGQALDPCGNANQRHPWIGTSWRGPWATAPHNMDGLQTPWPTDRVVFCNPPFSAGSQGAWLDKAQREAQRSVTSVVLVPARVDTKAQQDALEKCYAWTALKKRLDYQGLTLEQALGFASVLDFDGEDSAHAWLQAQMGAASLPPPADAATYSLPVRAPDGTIKHKRASAAQFPSCLYWFGFGTQRPLPVQALAPLGRTLHPVP